MYSEHRSLLAKRTCPLSFVGCDFEILARGVIVDWCRRVLLVKEVAFDLVDFQRISGMLERYRLVKRTRC